LNETWGSSVWPEIDEMNLDELQDVTYMGIRLGEIVEIPVKWFLLGETLSKDPLAMITYRKFLRSARAITDSLVVQIDKYKPTQVVMLNGLFLFEAILWDLCRLRGISVVTYERSFIIDSFVVFYLVAYIPDYIKCNANITLLQPSRHAVPETLRT
jgi:hypothetical protein